MTAAEAFYAHKRDAHKSQYDSQCAECQQKWAALLVESKAKAGLAA